MDLLIITMCAIAGALIYHGAIRPLLSALGLITNED